MSKHTSMNVCVAADVAQIMNEYDGGPSRAVESAVRSWVNPPVTKVTWIPYAGPDTVPCGEPLLMETESKVYTYGIGTFRKDSNGKPVGVVGGIFHFDTKIIRWARIAHLL